MERKFTGEADRTSTERELTDKFLSGEITFTEYSERWTGEGLGDEDDGEEAEVEIGVEYDDRKTSSQPRRTRRRRQLPAALSGLMGEANLRYARGDHDMAEKMCYEIIRQMPTAAEPFQTLAQIYEMDQEKSLQFNLLAAHLNPSDAERWIKVATILKEKGDMKQEIFCYTKAINANPQHLPYHMMRLELLRVMEENKILAPGNINTQICQVRMMGFIPDSEAETVLNIAKSVAQVYHSRQELRKACSAMEKAYKRFPNLFTLEDVNLYLELLIGLKDYNKCMCIFVEKCHIEFSEEIEAFGINENLQNVSRIIDCTFPENLPVDIWTKFIICLIHLKNIHLLDPLIDNMINTMDVETTGDIYLDIEEALTHEGSHKMALRLLKILVNSSKYSLPAVWLKYAECLSVLDLKLEAIVAYQTVVSLAPQHLDARLKLSALLKESSRIDEALKVLEQNETDDVVYSSLLHERCLILKSQGKMKEFLNDGQLLLSRHCFTIRHRMELNAFRTKDTADQLRHLREARAENPEDGDSPVFHDGNSNLTLEMEWNLLQDLFKTAYELQDYPTFERLTFLTLGSKRFQEYRPQLEFLCFLACFYNSDYHFAFNMIRDCIMKNPGMIGVWNTLNLINQRGEIVRHNKFVSRYLRRESSYNDELNILNANNWLISGTYKLALKEYIQSYKTKNTPLPAILAGITMLHISCQKHSTNKHTLITQGIAFLRYYKKLRGPDGLQEAYYNIGRAFHQLGLVYLARKYYLLALDVNNDLIQENPDILDLRREIAYNLHMIYKHDCPELAQMYLEKYIVI